MSLAKVINFVCAAVGNGTLSVQLAWKISLLRCQVRHAFRLSLRSPVESGLSSARLADAATKTVDCRPFGDACLPGESVSDLLLLGYICHETDLHCMKH